MAARCLLVSLLTAMGPLVETAAAQSTRAPGGVVNGPAGAGATPGATGTSATGTRPSDFAPPPSCLDRSITDELGQSLRARGVQKKDFLKRYRFEVLAHGGIYASDLLSSSYVYGGTLAWWLTEDLGLEVSVDRTPVALDLDKPISEFFGDPPFAAGTATLGLVSALWAPVHFKMKTADGGIIHGDAMLALGGGRLFHDTTQGIAVDGGLVVELYPARWLSFRLDLRDVILIQEAVAETRTTNNITATLGVGFWVPFW